MYFWEYFFCSHISFLQLTKRNSITQICRHIWPNKHVVGQKELESTGKWQKNWWRSTWVDLCEFPAVSGEGQISPRNALKYISSSFSDDRHCFYLSFDVSLKKIWLQKDFLSTKQKFNILWKSAKNWISKIHFSGANFYKENWHFTPFPILYTCLFLFLENLPDIGLSCIIQQMKDKNNVLH